MKGKMKWKTKRKYLSDMPMLYGIRKQLKKLSEEVFELQEAVIEHETVEDITEKLYTDHIAEELADVMVLWDR